MLKTYKVRLQSRSFATVEVTAENKDAAARLALDSEPEFDQPGRIKCLHVQEAEPEVLVTEFDPNEHKPIGT
jgi:hypothetical protein